MGVFYIPLRIELTKREKRRVEVMECTAISGNLLAKLDKINHVSIRKLEQICRKIDFSPNQVLEFKEGEKNDN